MKRAEIIKFNDNNRVIVYPVNTLEGGGGIASSPYFVLENPSTLEIIENLKKALNYSIIDAPRPLEWKFFRQKHLKSLGVKTMKALHKNSISVGVFIKDEKYHINPTINKGSRQGFHGKTEDRIIIPLSSNNTKLEEVIDMAISYSS